MDSDSIFLDVNHIRKAVEEKAIINDGLLLDSLIQYCDEKNIDIDVVSAIIKTDPIFVLRLQEEAEDLHLLKKSNESSLEQFI